MCWGKDPDNCCCGVGLVGRFLFAPGIVVVEVFEGVREKVQ
jgi:hypothetical protein